MGLLDLPAPLFDAVNGLLQGMPAGIQLAIWAALTGKLSMLIYWLCSAQEKVTAAKTAALEARRALNSYDGHEFGEMWPLVGASLRGSARHFTVVLGPALLGSLPALALIVWVSNTFGVLPPAPGAAIVVSTSPDIKLQAQPQNIENQRFIYPDPESTLTIASAATGAAIVTLPTPDLAPVVHKRRWWNTLIGNPAGYLAADGAVDEIRFDYQQQTFIPFGPPWLRTWEAPYFLLLIITSLAIKFLFRID